MILLNDLPAARPLERHRSHRHGSLDAALWMTRQQQLDRIGARCQ